VSPKATGVFIYVLDSGDGPCVDVCHPPRVSDFNKVSANGMYDSQGSQKWLESVRILSASVCRDKGKIISDKTPSTRRTRQCQGKGYQQL
jgi:hypothetical protein